MQLQALEGARDGCELRVRTKLSKLHPSQKAALDQALDAVNALVAIDAAVALHRIATKGDADAEEAEELSGSDATGPPADRLANHAAEATEAAVAEAIATAKEVAATAVAALSAEGAGGDLHSGDDRAERERVARESVEHLQALCTQVLARACTEAIGALCAYAARCRSEADRPSTPEPGAALEGALWVHALDWPFVSELERARWKARCLRKAGARLATVLSNVARQLGDEVKALRRELSTGLNSSPGGGSSGGGGEVVETTAALRQQLKGMATALRLDVSAGVDLVHEAVQLCAPVLCYVALGDC